MKAKSIVLGLLSLLFITSCNTDEGPGGKSSIEGYVYNIRHLPDNSLFPIDTVPAAKEDVFLMYGDEVYPGKDIETMDDGYYRFNNMREGNYMLYAFSSYDDGTKEAVYQKVKAKGDVSKADTIFIHTGKANGTAMIRGEVYIKYYNKGNLVSIDGQTEFPGVGHRVYLKHKGQNVVFDDARSDNNGVFVFQRLQPGEYEVYTDTEKIGDGYKNVLLPTETQTITVGKEKHTIYDLDEKFVININI